jgi:DMSO/TMAO reductase YedYZ molybdopterin-dependent catalytic subunit
VPGWYGTWSVKWLSRIIVTDRPFDGFFQTSMYSLWERRYEQPVQVPVTEMQVKSSIARPALHEVVPAQSKYRVIGAAWSGESAVAKVEVSTDGGEAWHDARLLDKPVPYAWRLWEYDWQTPARTGHYILMARARRDGQVCGATHWA